MSELSIPPQLPSSFLECSLLAGFSSPALAICVMAFLKLVSYAQVNKWCRLNLPTNRLRNKRLRRKSLSDPSGGFLLFALLVQVALPVVLMGKYLVFLAEFTCGDGIDETKNGRPETLKHYPNNLTLEGIEMIVSIELLAQVICAGCFLLVHDLYFLFGCLRSEVIQISCC